MLRSLFIALLIPIGLLAQTDEKAKSILKKVSETNSAYTDMAVSFSYTLKNEAADLNDTRNGKLTMVGNKFRLELMGQDIYSDGSIVWYVMNEDLEVHVKTLDEFKEETNIDPSNIFTQYEKGFKAKFHAEEKRDGKTLNVIDLFPEIPGKKPFSRIRLGVDKATNHIVYSKTFGKDGTDYFLEVTEMKTNISVRTEQFVFNAAAFESEDFDVVDFR